MSENTLYSENTWEEFGVSHIWFHTKQIDKVVTSRGTLIEMIERPNWGISCYMDNAIQSCEVDEKYYHEALVHPAMRSVKDPKRVMIIGGGEGCTAREVLKYDTVTQVDMYEWDVDVVNLFKTKYAHWSQGAWDDPRLRIFNDNIFEVISKIPSTKYDVVIVDLFDPAPENMKEWSTLLEYLQRWITVSGAIVIYSGIRNIFETNRLLTYISSTQIMNDKKLVQYKVYIPSFSGESTFILLKDPEYEIQFVGTTGTVETVETVETAVTSHLSNDIWKSYGVFNW